MSSGEAVTQWLRQLEAGDEEAARLLWQRYYSELVELARTRFGTTSRRVKDEEDVALSVMRCLYDGASNGHFAAVVNRQELWGLLATITCRKVIDQQRFLYKRKRGGGKVRGDSAVLGNSDDDRDGVGFDQFRGDDPTPEALTIAAEEFERLMSLLDDDRLRQVAQSKLEGYTNEEIGIRLGLACRSIERKLQRIRQVWAEELPQ